MDSLTSPELQGLFRDHPRLLKKLSGQEIRGINEYVEKRVQNEYADLLQQVNDLTMSRDYAERKYARTMETLEKEREHDKQLVEEYRRSFGNISQVLSNKEERYEGRYESLLKDVGNLEENYKAMNRAKLRLKEDNERKDMVIGNLHKEISSLKEKLEERANYDQLTRDSEKNRQEILRIKLDLDLQKRENSSLVKDIERLREGLKAGVFPDPEVVDTYLYSHSPRMKSVSFYNDSTTNTSKAVVPILSARERSKPILNCTTTNCQARRDLDDCREELARKCQENAYLSYLLAQARAKDPANTDIKKLGLNFYERRTSLQDREYNSRNKGSNSLYRPAALSYRKTDALVSGQMPPLRNRPLYK